MKVYMAPLEEITGYVYRNAYHAYFSPMDKYFAPFIAAKPQEGKAFSRRERNDILPENNKDLYLVPQVLTRSAEDFIRTAKALIEYGYEEVNINLGCPSKPVVARGRGSGFLDKLEELDAFLDEVFTKVNMRISIKTRLGRFDPEEIGPLLEIYNQYPMEELIIHPRIQTDYYKGKPRLEQFTYAYQNGKPSLCYNGDIFTKEDYEKIEKEFPQIDSVMIGRGVLADPSLLGKIKGEPEATKEQWTGFLQKLRDDYQRNSINDEKALFKMKEVWAYLRFSFPAIDVWNEKMKRIPDLQTYDQVVKEFLEQYPSKPGGPFGMIKTNGRFG